MENLMEALVLVLSIALVLVIIFSYVQTVRASFYRAQCVINDIQVAHLKEQIEYEQSARNSGWEDEAKFWRCVFLPEAERTRLENVNE
jgi:hypothetical protein